MTRFYAAVSLFEHGPLTRSEFVEITGWPPGACDKMLARLVDEGRIERLPGRVYAIKGAA